jgi:hypothetical protein
LRIPIPGRSDFVLALISAPLFAISWVYADPAVRVLLDPLFDQVIQAGRAQFLPLWQIKFLITGLYLACFILCSIATIPPLSLLGLLFPDAKPRSAAIVFAGLVAVLLIGTRAEYMFSMPYVGSLGGSLSVSALAGVALCTGAIASSRLRALRSAWTRR